MALLDTPLLAGRKIDLVNIKIGAPMWVGIRKCDGRVSQTFST